jgi:hypothetical protein
MKPEDLKDLASYRKALGIELSKSKESAVEFRYLPKCSVGDKVQPVLIVGPLHADMKGLLSKNMPKASGTCQLHGKLTRFEVNKGSFKEGTAVQAIKAAGLTNTVEVVEALTEGESQETGPKTTPTLETQPQQQQTTPPKVKPNPQALKDAQNLVATQILKRHQDLMQKADDKTKKRLATAMNSFKAAAVQQHGDDALVRAQEWLQLVEFVESGPAERRVEGQRLPTARQLAQETHKRWFKIEPELVGLIENSLLPPTDAETLRSERTKVTQAARAEAKDFGEKLRALEIIMNKSAEFVRAMRKFVEEIQQKAEPVRESHKLAYYEAFSAKEDQQLLGGKRQAFELHFKARPIEKEAVAQTLDDWDKTVKEVEKRNEGRKVTSGERETRRSLWMSYLERHDNGLKNAPKILHQNLQKRWDDVNDVLQATEWNATAADAALEQLKLAIEQAEETIRRNEEAKQKLEKLRDVLTRATEYVKLDAELPETMTALAVEARVAENAGNYILALEKVEALQTVVNDFPGELAEQFRSRLAIQQKAVESFQGKLTEEAVEKLSTLVRQVIDKVKLLKTAKKNVLDAVKAAEQALLELEDEVVYKEDDIAQVEKKLADFGAIEARYRVVKDAWQKRFENAPPDYQKEREAKKKLEELEELWKECLEAFRTRDLDDLTNALKKWGQRLIEEVDEAGAKDEADKAALKAKKDLEDAQAKPMKDAIAWGNGIFTSGTIGAVWGATVTSLQDKGLESVPGEFTVTQALQLVPLWTNRSGGNINSGGILSNLHVPGGRPQPKWVNHSIPRDEIQINFCAYFRNRKTNIHVTVEPNSYFQRYYTNVDVQEIVNRKVIWKRLDNNTKQLLRDNYSGVLVE